MLKTKDLFSFDKSLAGEELSKFEYPWQALGSIPLIIMKIGSLLSDKEYNEVYPSVWIHKSVVVAPTAFIAAPAIIGEESEIRNCAFIRGSVLVGKNCIIGNSTEIKNSILFDRVQVPHFNYVGDSILGFGAHMGAGAVTSNVKGNKSKVSVFFGEEKFETGLRKLGAMIGDGAEIGCNCVLNPGTVIGRNTQIYPLSSVRGAVESNCIYKSVDTIVTKQ